MTSTTLTGAPGNPGNPGNPGTPNLPDPATLSYEQARDEMITLVQRLEAGGDPLETSLAIWERCEALAKRCQEWLDGARERLSAADMPASAGGNEPRPQ
ncbi:MAG: exodeoxyribonuclease VII small subunit [Cellulomonadaceae bacterium]|jgi:exodeoxyribonuclease VII small subunit|nr:exodeoxyribonuclease VII small subunit [Cellulomonadaceae bacterium]